MHKYYLITLLLLACNNMVSCALIAKDTHSIDSRLYVLMESSLFISGNDHPLKNVNDIVLEKIKEDLEHNQAEFIELSIEETKIITNHYLFSCFDHWDSYLEVINKRKIDLSNPILILSIHPTESNKPSGIEANIYLHLKDAKFPREFNWISGKRYTNIKPNEKNELVVSIVKYFEKEINNIKAITNHSSCQGNRMGNVSQTIP
ncbi:hypothetical protein [Desulfogranum japonicum]|uniref:hypothetical protein n=1 Tax=Desulfogranum japonicum TaxID=231447 RepID=UPI00048C5980|nr:hypothetical protein [Desulfogranum japonicum]